MGTRWYSSVRRLPVPASVANLELEGVRIALTEARANVSAAAKALGVPSVDLRKLIWSDPRLIEVALEAAEQLIDQAEENIRRAVHDQAHPDRALQAAIYVLSHSAAARGRGWCRHGPDSSDYLYSPPPAAALTVVWQGDMPPGYRPSLPSAPEARRTAEAASSLPVDSLEDKRVH